MVYIPVGNAREGDQAPIEMITPIEVHYPQHNHDTCLFKSVASVLHYLKEQNLGSYFSSVATRYSRLPVDEQLEEMCKQAFARAPGIIIQKWWTKKK